MQRALKGVLWAVVGLIVLAATAFAWGRLRPPTPEQARALALLQTDSKPPQGRNAYPWLWFADFDVPIDQLDAAYAKDRQRVLAWEANVKPGPDMAVPEPQADYPALPPLSQADRDVLCSWREVDCLGKVRAHRDAVRDVLERHRQRLLRDEMLSQFDRVSTALPLHPAAPMPRYAAPGGLWQTAIAADFIDGQQTQALDAACTQVATMRRLHAHSNTLISTMIFAARLRGAVPLFVQLLSAVPADQALPASCAAAFAPLEPADVDLCTSMRGEYSMVGSLDMLSPQQHWYDNLAWNAKATRRLLAPRYAALCDAALPQRLLADQRVSLADASSGFDIFELISNSAGSMLARIPGPAFDAYLARQQDVAASLRMGALMIWLRESHDQSLPLRQRLSARPAWLHFAADRHVEAAMDGTSLQMDMRIDDPNLPKATVWPLPQTR